MELDIMLIQLVEVKRQSLYGDSWLLWGWSNIRNLGSFYAKSIYKIWGFLVLLTMLHRLKYTQLLLIEQSKVFKHNYLGYILLAVDLGLAGQKGNGIYHLIQIQPIFNKITLHFHMELSLFKWSWTKKLCLMTVPIMINSQSETYKWWMMYFKRWKLHISLSWKKCQPYLTTHYHKTPYMECWESMMLSMLINT